MFKALNRLTKIDCPEIWAVFQGVKMTYEEFCKIRGIPYKQEAEKPVDAKQPNEGVPSNPRGRPPKKETDTETE